ncbi:AccI family restriction endonuclease [Liberiplasma polymorphum]|uniref:AccI family restriction endonuclease n=1 Tax=Liberiplasma polymorphum TaxID=3374570 RepID=UPI00377111AD
MKNNIYIEQVLSLINSCDNDLIDLSIDRIKGTAPTQAFSEFLTNKNQGDWAELTFQKTFNDTFNEYVAVRYGLDNDSVAGDPGFKDFYNGYQQELDTIGKKPDLLIFKIEDYQECWDYNISNFDENKLEKIVPKAVMGLEVRSSSFLYNIYEIKQEQKQQHSSTILLDIRKNIIDRYGDLLKEKNEAIYDQLVNFSLDSIYDLTFRAVSWKSSRDLVELSRLIRKFKSVLTVIKKRDYLSVTPKVEDLKVVYNWINRYGVPHYYCQIFFDCAFIIGFLDILELISKYGKEKNEYYSIESGDAKNQNKTTIKINTRKCHKIIDNITMPKHTSMYKKLDKGRLLFYVTFEPSKGEINKELMKVVIGDE